tara:strand:- start:162 stop:1199 length:1038 start_codon:yes stop_codon:yes gene_type:complete
MNINGDMSVWQRGTSFTGLSSGNPLSADRMYFKITSSGTWTLTRESDAPAGTGFTYSLKALCTSADSSANQLRLYHTFEGQDVTQLAYGTSSAKSLAVSFWVKSNVTGTYSSSLESHITGRQASLNFTVDSAGTWEKKELIFGGDSASAITATNGSGITMSIWLGSLASLGTGGTTNGQWVTDSSYTRLNGGGNVYLGDTANNYLQITGLQIESGDTATDFEHRSYGEELAACERYFQKFGGTAYATIASGMQPNTTNAKFHLSYRQEMRSAPSITIGVGSTVADLIVTDRTAFDQVLSGLSGNTAGKTSAYLSAQYSAVGATGRGILLAVKSGTTTTLNFDSEL